MTTSPVPHDPYLWLEEVEGTRALEWVAQRNAHAADTLAVGEGFTRTKAAILKVLDSTEKIPLVAMAGGYLYNFWRDGDHERGLWRRTTLESYRGAEPAWEVLLDVDELSRVEGVEWVWHGAQVLRTGPMAHRRALVDLSRGGSDADITREFDLATLSFVPESEGGFTREESKGSLGWIDEDTVFAQSSTDGEPTASGYPRRARRWKRGTALGAAPIVLEAATEDLLVTAFHDRTPGFERDWVRRALTFYSSELFLVGHDGVAERLKLPTSAEAGAHREWLLVELREDWRVDDRTYPAGSLLAIRLAQFRSGSRNFRVLFAPTPSTALVGATWTRHHLVINVLDDVKNRLEVLTPPEGEGEGDTGWRRRRLAGTPAIGTVSVGVVDRDDPDFEDSLWMTAADYLSPSTLSLVRLGADGGTESVEPLKQAPAFFDSSGLVSEQRFARSLDGTRIPYVVVRPRDLPMDGSAPTLLYGYGGFEIALTPNYSGALGRAWLERGGVYVVAGIRGGGEYGPTWHQAALRDNRHRAYEDFASVARELIENGITSPSHLGIQGGSNGGLLTGNMLTQYPELFGAVVSQVPLLDMRRYHLLLAGASWVAEYGDPDTPDDWEFLRTFSPYHLVDPGRSYPPVLLTTSTRDDRVHPGHARKMTALLREHGKDVTYWENVEGGHGGASTNDQAAHMASLAYEFLGRHLGL